MSEWQVEMLWVCAACAHRNRGRDLACGRCGKAKADEEYLMPDDASRAQAVTEAALLRLAASGPNWRCRFCGSDQRRHDDGCGHCGAAQAFSPAAPAASPPAPRRARPRPRLVYALLALPLVLLVACGALVALRSSRPRPAALGLAGDAAAAREARLPLRSARWEHAVVVERYALRPGEGFAEAKPEGAVDVRAAGSRVHHYDEVPDGFKAETYTETVPDGFKTETYSDRVACGEDCTTTPRVCRQKCTNNQNGFATCRDECTGGDRKCSTRYCNQTKTRQVPATKTVTRTRQVPKTRRVERSAPYFQWRAWGWGDDRTLRRAGEGAGLAWPPEAELAPPQPLARGEQERSRREARYAVTFDDGGRELRHEPKTAEEFLAFASAGAAQITLRGGEPVSFRPAP
ncbi:MAG TPA: hypothetical protein VFS43_18765 [Polyangiaceae bacterium]|nr:hypothetical protein [Polyangiaceae bacterium]